MPTKKDYHGIQYDTNTDYKALKQGTTDPNLLNQYGQQRAAKIYGEGMEQYFDTVPDQYKHLQYLGSPWLDPASSGYLENPNTGGNMNTPAGNVNTPTTTQAPSAPIGHQSQFNDQMMKTLSALTDMLKTPLTYDSKNDEGFQAAQRTIGDNVYRDMARRGVAYSSMTPEQSYQLSMQALPQFQQNWQNQQQQNISNQMAMLGQLGQLDMQDYQKFQDKQQNLFREADITGTLYTPEEKALKRDIDPSLHQYSDDYMAEINRRMAINPNDPKIFQLHHLRNQKIAQGGLPYQKTQLGTPTMASQQFDYGKMRDYTTDTGVRFDNEAQWRAYQNATPQQLDAIIDKYSKQPGGIQAYINTLEPTSGEYVVAQKARNRLIRQNPELAKHGKSEIGTQTIAGQMADRDLKMSDQEIHKNELVLSQLPKKLETELSIMELQAMGLDIANQMANIDLKHYPERIQTEIAKIKEDLEAGKLANAARRIENSNMDAMLKAQIGNMLANTASTQYDITYKQGMLDIQRSQAAQAAAGATGAATSEYISGLADNYRRHINNNFMETTRDGDTTSKSINTGRAQEYIDRLISSGDSSQVQAAIMIAQEMGLRFDAKKP